MRFYLENTKRVCHFGPVRRRLTWLVSRALFGVCTALIVAGMSQRGEAQGVPLSVDSAVVNPRFGVVYSRPLPAEDIARLQGEFGAGAWLDMTEAPSSVPGKVPLLPLGPEARLSGDALATLVAQYPAGTVWYLGGEANVPTQGNTSGADYAPYFHDAAATIRAVDPTARIMAASVLNFVDTCRGCAGYLTGREWVDEFRSAYLGLYGEEPPVDVWALDSYLLDWNSLPMIDSAFLPAQVRGLRAYLDATPGQAGKPIWVTEFGVVWAYESLRWTEVDGIVSFVPARAYRLDLLRAWLDDTIAWLETEGVAMGVERWFLFATSTPAGEPWYTGIELLEPAGDRYRLSGLGAQYAGYARASAPGTADPPEAPAPVASAAEDSAGVHD
jgi:hypothetical protein